jgi:hypothetical protein
VSRFLGQVQTVDTSKISNPASDTSGDGNASHQMKVISATDSIDNTPMPAEERKRLSRTYDNIKLIDTTFVDNDNDSLKFHLKYYCVKSDTIAVPSTYALDENPPHSYKTYGFAFDILLKTIVLLAYIAIRRPT